MRELNKTELLLAAITNGVARYEVSQFVPTLREVCVDGLRYSVELSPLGVPVVHPVLERALRKALDKVKA